jgi:hypothetical protein
MVVAHAAQAGTGQADADAIAVGVDPELGGQKHVQGTWVEAREVGTGDDADRCFEVGCGWQRVSSWGPGLSRAQQVSRAKRAALVTPESSAEERPAAPEHARHVDAASNRDVPHAGSGAVDPPGLACSQLDEHAIVTRHPRPGRRRQRDRTEQLEARRVLLVSDRPVGPCEELGHERSSRRDPLVHVPGPPAVLDRGDPRDGDDGDHGADPST